MSGCHLSPAWPGGWTCAPKPELFLRIIQTTTFTVPHCLMGDAEIMTQMAEGGELLRRSCLESAL